MDGVKLKKLSKFMSLVLRHDPQRVGIELDEHGWTDLSGLADALARQIAGVRLEHIVEVVRTDGKGRYVVDGSRIRASQGHSVDVDTVGAAVLPPSLLYHGTTARNWQSICEHGSIASMGRKHVHLSADLETARNVAQRRKGPHVILRIDSERMHLDALEFFRAANGVWLTVEVPLAYVSELNSR